MDKKGFTLVELLAVISIMGVVMILVIPTILNALYNSKKKLREYEVKDLLDAGKYYVTDLDLGEVKYEYTDDEPIEIDGKTITKGTKMSGYTLKKYIIDNGGILVTMKTLVENGYFDKECHYAGEVINGETLTKDRNCKYDKDCTLRVGIEYRLSEDKAYYITTNYTSEIVSGCELEKK